MNRIYNFSTFHIRLITLRYYQSCFYKLMDEIGVLHIHPPRLHPARRLVLPQRKFILSILYWAWPMDDLLPQDFCPSHQSHMATQTWCLEQHVKTHWKTVYLRTLSEVWPCNALFLTKEYRKNYQSLPKLL